MERRDRIIGVMGGKKEEQGKRKEWEERTGKLGLRQKEERKRKA